MAMDPVKNAVGKAQRAERREQARRIDERKVAVRTHARDRRSI